MPLTRRYTPEKPSGESCYFGCDYSMIIPLGVGIDSGEVHLWTNTVAPVLADIDWTIGPVLIEGRTVYAQLSGGIDGTDYQVRWSVTDTDGNVWPRTVLQLVSETS